MGCVHPARLPGSPGRHINLSLQIATPRTGRPRTSHQRDLPDPRALRLSARPRPAAARGLAHQSEEDATHLSGTRPAIAQQNAQAPSEGEAARGHRAATRPIETWAMDFVHNQLATGRKLRVLTVVDTFSRFSPALEPRFTFRGIDVVILEEVGRQVGFPATIRVDQGHRVCVTRFGSVGISAWRHARFL
jgi:hypothetical protein